jgi:hypothetical protein
MGQVKTTHVKFPVPDDVEIMTAGIFIGTYIREDGSNGYWVHTRGQAPMTTFLGMTLLAQEAIKQWGHEE